MCGVHASFGVLPGRRVTGCSPWWSTSSSVCGKPQAGISGSKRRRARHRSGRPERHRSGQPEHSSWERRCSSCSCSCGGQRTCRGATCAASSACSRGPARSRSGREHSSSGRQGPEHSSSAPQRPGHSSSGPSRPERHRSGPERHRSRPGHSHSHSSSRTGRHRRCSDRRNTPTQR